MCIITGTLRSAPLPCHTSNHHHSGAKLHWINWLRRQTRILNGRYISMCSYLHEIAWTDTLPTNIISQWRDEWKSVPVVNYGLPLPGNRQPGFDLTRHYWALLNCFRTNQCHCASCRKKWGLAATGLCPCGKCQVMSLIVNSCAQSKTSINQPVFLCVYIWARGG